MLSFALSSSMLVCAHLRECTGGGMHAATADADYECQLLIHNRSGTSKLARDYDAIETNNTTGTVRCQPQ